MCSICYKSIPQKQHLFGPNSGGVTSGMMTNISSSGHSDGGGGEMKEGSIEPLQSMQPSPVATSTTAKSPDIRFRPYELSKPSSSPKVVCMS